MRTEPEEGHIISKKTILIVVALAVVEVVTAFSADAGAGGAKKSGLIGIQYGSENFTNAENFCIGSSKPGGGKSAQEMEKNPGYEPNAERDKPKDYTI